MVYLENSHSIYLVLCVFLLVDHLDGFNVSMNSYLSLDVIDDFRWSLLIETAIHVYEAISVRGESQDSAWSEAATLYDFALIVFQERTHRALAAFESELSLRNSDRLLVACELPVDIKRNELTSKLIKASSAGGDVEMVIVLSETPKFATDLLSLVSQEVTFRWTSLKHTAEWLVVSPSETLMDSIRRESLIEVDFMTLVFTYGSDLLAVAQKSRRKDFQVRTVPKSCNDFFLANRIVTNVHFDSDIKSGQCQCIDYAGQLRNAAIHYLRSKKSVLDGMVLPAAVLSEMEEHFYTYAVADVNRTAYDGYSIALLEHLAGYMGFTYTLVAEDDRGFYGDVLDSGEATGLTGQLTRREAALTTLPLSITESRRSRVDYIVTPTVTENVVIIYKLPVQTDHLDLTYIDIIPADFFLYLIGPLVVMGLIGTCIHVLTNSCYSARPETFKKSNLRLLTKFPEHVCFHTERTYKVQSGLILRTSWAIFWFIISSAYSAYLVTTFAVKPQELALKTFKQLMDHPEYKIGMLQHDSALQSFFRGSKDEVLSQVWSRLQQLNKTDPSTFCPDIEFHRRRVKEGGYALIHMTSVDIFPKVENAEVRMYLQKGLESIIHAYIAVPKNTFYYPDLSRAVRSLEESGILAKLKSAYIASQTEKPTGSKVSTNGSVTFPRIQLLVYCALGGVGIGLVSLLLELSLYTFFHKTYDNTECTGNHNI